ncbi:Hypothetical predicted protein [Pelobates cultripes]|uniref:Uncharacterized protein n=1 Tax=Pelobates cultripes TaxID=61616 RepID=A0AAD1T1G4_PELCU|nr:Hypothetical predicted protein [Pelobates cultripes]
MRRPLSRVSGRLILAQAPSSSGPRAGFPPRIGGVIPVYKGIKQSFGLALNTRPGKESPASDNQQNGRPDPQGSPDPTASNPNKTGQRDRNNKPPTLHPVRKGPPYQTGPTTPLPPPYANAQRRMTKLQRQGTSGTHQVNAQQREPQENYLLTNFGADAGTVDHTNPAQPGGLM